MKDVMVHSLADVKSNDIGRGTRIWQLVVVLSGAKIGEECNICANVFIESDVAIGNGVTIKCGVQVWDGICIEDGVFIGPNVTFTNDKMPRSGRRLDGYPPTVIEEGASVGGGAVILPGIRVGRGAMVGAGAVVTRDVPPGVIVAGNPARITRSL